jgi:hypothetical protein
MLSETGLLSSESRERRFFLQACVLLSSEEMGQWEPMHSTVRMWFVSRRRAVPCERI